MTIEAEFTDMYKCPNIFVHILKNRVLSLHKQEKLMTKFAFKEGDKFNAQGVICDTWAKITGKGEWEDSTFKFQTLTGGFARCTMAAPLPVTQFFSTKGGNINCPVSTFFSTFSGTDPDKLIDFLNKVCDFQPKVTTVEYDYWNWEVEGVLVEHNITMGYRKESIVALTAHDAAAIFLARCAGYKVDKINCKGKAAF